MKIKRLIPVENQEFVTYYGGKKAVEIGDFKFRKDDIRGCWISNVANIDTPKTEDKEEYQNHLRGIIANMASYNMNTMVFQVRPSNDAYYPSKLNPWSRFITGTEGRDPGFDVLQFVIDEAKKYNIRVHAWMNPYRVSTQKLSDLNMTKEEYLNTLHELNFARRNPDCTIVDGVGKVILKPASDKVIAFVSKTVEEIAMNYDVESVHIDDYFYPYAKIDEALEQDDYLNYIASNNKIDFDDWRRLNVDKMIKAIHKVLKKSFNKTNRKVQFGISPFGIYRTNSTIKVGGWDKGSLHSAGALECYSELYSDVYKWMKKGWIDYVVPQVYFPFERKDVTYHDLTTWWNEICQETKTILYIGQGLYQMGNSEYWQNPNEITNQLKFNSTLPYISGTIFFTHRDLRLGQNAIKDEALRQLKQIWNQK